MLTQRVQTVGDCEDATDIWQRLGVAHPEQVADMEAAQLRALAASTVKAHTTEAL